MASKPFSRLNWQALIPPALQIAVFATMAAIVAMHDGAAL